MNAIRENNNTPCTVVVHRVLQPSPSKMLNYEYFCDCIAQNVDRKEKFKLRKLLYDLATAHGANACGCPQKAVKNSSQQSAVSNCQSQQQQQIIATTKPKKRIYF